MLCENKLRSVGKESLDGRVRSSLIELFESDTGQRPSFRGRSGIAPGEKRGPSVGGREFIFLRSGQALADHFRIEHGFVEEQSGQREVWSLK